MQFETKLCECGCREWIYIKNKGKNSIRFKPGHNGRGRYKELNSNWKGGKHTDRLGYILICSPDHPHRNAAGYVREHRLVMEHFLGRYLETWEIVHHKDGDKQNNNIDNLQLTNHSKHTTAHNILTDVFNRRCCICKLFTTRFVKKLMGRRPKWYKAELPGLFLCHNCYEKKRIGKLKTSIMNVNLQSFGF